MEWTMEEVTGDIYKFRFFKYLPFPFELLFRSDFDLRILFLT